MNKQQHSAWPWAFLHGMGTQRRGTKATWRHMGVQANHAGRGLFSLLSLSLAFLPQSKACPPCLRLPALPAPPQGTGPPITRGLPAVPLSLPGSRRRQRCQHYTSEHGDLGEARFGEGERGGR